MNIFCKLILTPTPIQHFKIVIERKRLRLSSNTSNLKLDSVNEAQQLNVVDTFNYNKNSMIYLRNPNFFVSQQKRTFLFKTKPILIIIYVRIFRRSTNFLTAINQIGRCFPSKFQYKNRRILDTGQWDAWKPLRTSADVLWLKKQTIQYFIRLMMAHENFYKK